MNDVYKEIFSASAFVLTFVMFFPYIRSILNGHTKPHVFSWLIWAMGTFIVFFAQLADGGGIGAWPIGLSACITSYIAVLAYTKVRDTSITRSDWCFLFVALCALPIWFVTSDPMWAVVLLTLADLVGFGPTIRRSCTRPHEESLQFFALASVRNSFVVVALENYSITTVLFPAAIGLACIFLVLYLIYQRRNYLECSSTK